MPLRLYVTMLGRILKWLTIMDASDGVLCNYQIKDNDKTRGEIDWQTVFHTPAPA